MRDPRINLRSRELAALLAFLVPGLGHFYQGRRLKAGIYCVGILTLFYSGMVLGDWQPVYSKVVYAHGGRAAHDGLQMQPRESGFESNFSIGYAAQFFTGLPALPSLLQQNRFQSDAGVVTSVRETIDSDFVGVFHDLNEAIPVTGRLHLEPGRLGSGAGSFEGTSADGTPVSADVSGAVKLGRRVFGSPRRKILISGLSDVHLHDLQPGRLEGTVTRSFLDWYQAPRDNAELDRLHGKLSQNYDIACVFTWIAGLLNLMAIWDAYDGPAYGYGDEEPDDEDESSEESD